AHAHADGGPHRDADADADRHAGPEGAADALADRQRLALQGAPRLPALGHREGDADDGGHGQRARRAPRLRAPPLQLEVRAAQGGQRRHGGREADRPRQPQDRIGEGQLPRDRGAVLARRDGPAGDAHLQGPLTSSLRLGVLAFGDSITNGGGELQWGVALQSWALWVARALGVPFTSYAFDGARARDVTDKQMPAFERDDRDRDARYRLGCPYIGVNDGRAPDR